MELDRSSVFSCSLIELPKIIYREGNISFVQNRNEVPFDVKRVFFLYDIPGGISRGAHAHIECHQLLVAVSGSFEVMLDDGKVKKTVMLNQPFRGLHIPPGMIDYALQGLSPPISTRA